MNNSFTSSNLNEGCNFTGTSDFKWCMKCGGEVVFIWNGITYCCFGKLTPPGKTETMLYISKADCEENWEASEKWCETSDDVLEYMVGFDRLRDVITQVKVIDRTI